MYSCVVEDVYCLVEGDDSGHIALAQYYNKGKGVEMSFEKAFDHYLQAAKSSVCVCVCVCVC